MERKIVLGLVLTLVVLVFIPWYWMTEPARQATAQGRFEREATVRGAELYEVSCSPCHGARGEGGIGPELRNLGQEREEEYLMKVIAEGRGIMPAWSEERGGVLKEHQIRDLATFIRNWDDALLTKPVEGDSFQEASALYVQKCAPCHGADREGLIGPPLTEQALAAMSVEDIQQVISQGRPGTVMTAWGNTLSAEQITALAHFLSGR